MTPSPYTTIGWRPDCDLTNVWAHSPTVSYILLDTLLTRPGQSWDRFVGSHFLWWLRWTFEIRQGLVVERSVVCVLPPYWADGRDPAAAPPGVKRSGPPFDMGPSIGSLSFGLDVRAAPTAQDGASDRDHLSANLVSGWVPWQDGFDGFSVLWRFRVLIQRIASTYQPRIAITFYLFDHG